MLRRPRIFCGFLLHFVFHIVSVLLCAFLCLICSTSVFTAQTCFRLSLFCLGRKSSLEPGTSHRLAISYKFGASFHHGLPWRSVTDWEV